MILFEKYGQHRPLNWRSERYAREGVDLSLSTVADQVGADAANLMRINGTRSFVCDAGALVLALLALVTFRRKIGGLDRSGFAAGRE